MKSRIPGTAFPANFITPQISHQLNELIAGTELQEIQLAVQGSGAGQPVFVHFSKALELLSSRQLPNYRQAVIEAIAAVDYVMAQLGSRRQQSETTGSYTANASHLVSIRYVLAESSIMLSFEKARYWLVACASLINHFKSAER